MTITPMILLTGVLIFLARICDVSLGTMRTIFTVQGRALMAFGTGIFEIVIWITVVSTVIQKINDAPILILFYALGYATGNVVGIRVERKLAFGQIILRVITRTAGQALADRIRHLGQPVTIFTGEGMMGPVIELYVVCRRRDLKWLLPLVKEEDPQAFFITEHARDVSKILQPIYQPVTGWRSVFKKK